MFVSHSSDQGKQNPEGVTSEIELVTRGRWTTHQPVPTWFDQLAVGPHGLDEPKQHRYKTGRPPRGAELLAQVADKLPGATVYLDGHYPVVRQGGHRFTWAGSWFGDTAHADSCVQAWKWLDAAVKRHWDDRAGLGFTPSTTGRDLWLRTINGDGFPVLSTGAQDLIRSTSGQGRIETMSRPKPAPLGATARLYDARLAYLACLRNMPVGEPLVFRTRELPGEHDPYRAEVTWQAPRDWDRPGILPAMVDGGGWSWPLSGRGWCDGAEILVAQRHGWTIHAHTLMTFPQRLDVFRTWNDRLQRILVDSRNEPQAGLIRHAVRAMALHALGSFAGREHRETCTGTLDQVPAGAYNIRPAAGDLWLWTIDKPAAWPQLSHPEWTAAIWGRARARLLDTNGVGALHMRPGSVIAFRTDAILTTDHAHFPDDGRAGQYRLQGATKMNRWPRGNAEALRLANECKR